jgi:hypothetical protein
MVEDLSFTVFILSYIRSKVVFGSWLGSYHEYGSYIAISNTSIENPMEKANRFMLAGFRSWLGLSSH